MTLIAGFAAFESGLDRDATKGIRTVDGDPGDKRQSAPSCANDANSLVDHSDMESTLPESSDSVMPTPHLLGAA